MLESASIRLHQAKEAHDDGSIRRPAGRRDRPAPAAQRDRPDDRGRPQAGDRPDHQQPGRAAAEIAKAGKNPKVVIEATYGWYWAVDVLEAAGAEVHLAHPLGVKAFSYRRVKNDERDAADLADLLRMGRLPEAWIAPAEIRELRELTRYRHLCRHRHRCRYAEARIMPSGRAACRPRVVAGVKASA